MKILTNLSKILVWALHRAFWHHKALRFQKVYRLMMETIPCTSTSSKDINRLINPITGQFLHSQAEEKMDNEMSEDEKFREAERMFVLFERVKSNNFLKVVIRRNCC